MAIDRTENMHEGPEAARGRSDLGGYALLLGIVAFVVLFVPLVGDSLAVVLAIAALVLGFIAIRRHEVDRASRVWTAVLGAVLGAMTLFVGVATFLVTSLFG